MQLSPRTSPAARRLPAKEALKHRNERLTYTEMWDAAGGIAKGLRGAGMECPDRVGVLLEPSVFLALSLFGISRAVATFVPIHHSLLADHGQHIVRDCGMTGLITDAAHFDRQQGALG